MKNVKHALDAFRIISEIGQRAETQLNRRTKSEHGVRYIKTALEEIQANIEILRWVTEYEERNVDYDYEPEGETVPEELQRGNSA